MCMLVAVSEDDKRRIAAWHTEPQRPTQSPFGPDDEIGMLNLISTESVRRALSQLDPWKVFDLSVDMFVGMPTWTGSGDLGYQIWMSHTPRGTVIDDASGSGREGNELISYSGDSIAMYTHSGTHVDTLNHFGLRGEIWNRFAADDHVGRVWDVAGADKLPPVIARGVLLDVPAALGMDRLPDSYGITTDDLVVTMRRQGVALEVGDVVLVRTGQMTVWPDPDRYLHDAPGLTLESAEFLAKAGVVAIGADNATVEKQPADPGQFWPPVHTFLLAQAGIPMIEVMNLEELSAEQLYTFAYIGANVKLRGATGAPVRPLAIPFAR